MTKKQPGFALSVECVFLEFLLVLRTMSKVLFQSTNRLMRQTVGNNQCVGAPRKNKSQELPPYKKHQERLMKICAIKRLNG